MLRINDVLPLAKTMLRLCRKYTLLRDDVVPRANIMFCIDLLPLVIYNQLKRGVFYENCFYEISRGQSKGSHL